MSAHGDLIQCVAREIKMRERVYPNRVARGHMSQAACDREIATMAAVLKFLVEHRPASEPAPVPPQGSLFGGG